MSAAWKFRVVILGQPKELCLDTDARRIYSDMVFEKQIAFMKTSESFICTGPQDMVSTHVVVYDTSALFRPKLILALRISLFSLSNHRSVELPHEVYKPLLSESTRYYIESLKHECGDLVDCGSLFLNPEYSYKKVGISFVDLGLFFMVREIRRLGHGHFVAALNESYKVADVVERIGRVAIREVFVHPVVHHAHRFLAIDQFSGDWIAEGERRFAPFLDSELRLDCKTLSRDYQLGSVAV